MSEAPKTEQDPMDTFTPRTGSDANPFTADLKGDFASNFGTNTNAVSQIFKEGGFGSGNKKKIIAIAAGVLLLLGVGIYAISEMGLLEGGDEAGEEAAEEAGEEGDTSGEEGEAGGEAEAEAEAGAEGEGEAGEGATDETELADTATKTPPKAAPKAMHSAPAKSHAVPTTGEFAIVSPKQGATYSYDETASTPEFRWEGGAGTIVFSRHRSMNPEEFRGQGRDGVYRANSLYPGQWYWQVQGDGAGSEVRSFTVAAPVRRNIAMVEPKSGSSISGQGGVVSWTGDHKITHYRVELSTGGWAHPNYRFATAGMSLAITGVSAGTYQMRLGAFSEVSGRWEYTAPVPVTVQ
jgi:hypothetical protein